MRIQFNTGRLYQADGQRIVAEWKDGTILFRDLSRMIGGSIEWPAVPANELELRHLVMEAYDFNTYRDVWVGAVAHLKWQEPTRPLLVAAQGALMSLEFYIRRDFAGTAVFAERMAELDPLRAAIAAEQAKQSQ